MGSGRRVEADVAWRRAAAFGLAPDRLDRRHRSSEPWWRAWRRWRRTGRRWSARGDGVDGAADALEHLGEGYGYGKVIVRVGW